MRISKLLIPLPLAALLFACAGCAAIPWRAGHREPSPPPPVTAMIPDTTALAIAAADSADSADTARAALSGAAHSRPHATGGSRDAPADPRPPASALADTSGITEPLPVSVALADSERSHLAGLCREDLAAAGRMVAAISRRSLTADEQDRLATIGGFMAQSSSALERRDIQAAVNLARKARLLAEAMASK